MFKINSFNNMDELINIIDSLHEFEKKVLLELKQQLTVEEVVIKSRMDYIKVMRGAQWLNNKKLIIIKEEKKELINLTIRGKETLKKGLPELRFLEQLIKKNNQSFDELKQVSKLDDNEFNKSVGFCRGKKLIEITQGIISITKEGKTYFDEEESKTELLKVFEKEEQQLKNELKNKKELSELIKRGLLTSEVKIMRTLVATPKGLKLIKRKSDFNKTLLERNTPTLIKNKEWEKTGFRRYNVLTPVPKLYGGKRHFVNQSIDYGRKIWTEMGFEEMSGDIIVSSFWNFDALFTAQDHPVRELQDTFFLNEKTDLPDKKIVSRVKESHEKGVSGSKGWQYSWNEEDSKKLVLRTHTTCISSQTLAKVYENKENLPKKFFAIGKCFRNETIDWSHGFEFNQTEGIVIDKNANFRHLLGYLKQFFKKMGFEKIRFRPAYFPYTEPSVEIDVFHPERKVWLELGGAGIFRPEVTVPLLGRNIPILAWGPGFDRILMDYYQIKDLRELYKNDLSQLRKMKFWIK